MSWHNWQAEYRPSGVNKPVKRVLPAFNLSELSSGLVRTSDGSDIVAIDYLNPSKDAPSTVEPEFPAPSTQLSNELAYLRMADPLFIVRTTGRDSGEMELQIGHLEDGRLWDSSLTSELFSSGDTVIDVGGKNGKAWVGYEDADDNARFKKIDLTSWTELEDILAPEQFDNNRLKWLCSDNEYIWCLHRGPGGYNWSEARIVKYNTLDGTVEKKKYTNDNDKATSTDATGGSVQIWVNSASGGTDYIYRLDPDSLAWGAGFEVPETIEGSGWDEILLRGIVGTPKESHRAAFVQMEDWEGGEIVDKEMRLYKSMNFNSEGDVVFHNPVQVTSMEIGAFTTGCYWFWNT